MAFITYWGNEMKTRILGAASILALVFSLATRADDSIEPTDFTPDHYLSYRIMNFYQQSFKVFLKDQFIQGLFNVYRPIRLLNPSDKLHILPDGTVNEARRNNPRLHYVAYEIYWENPAPITKTVHINNQFEDADLTLESLNELL